MSPPYHIDEKEKESNRRAFNEMCSKVYAESRISMGLPFMSPVEISIWTKFYGNLTLMDEGYY